MLNDCGYKFSFSRNLAAVILMSCCLLIIMAIYGVLDFLRKRSGLDNVRLFPYRRTAWMANFSLRFVYEFFFEICLCLLIHSAVAYEADAFLYSISIILFLGILALVAVLFAFFWRWGPYRVPKCYESNSLRKSWWGIRPLCPEDECCNYQLTANADEEVANMKEDLNDNQQITSPKNPA